MASKSRCYLNVDLKNKRNAFISCQFPKLTRTQIDFKIFLYYRAVCCFFSSESVSEMTLSIYFLNYWVPFTTFSIILSSYIVIVSEIADKLLAVRSRDLLWLFYSCLMSESCFVGVPNRFLDCETALIALWSWFTVEFLNRPLTMRASYPSV